jgi:asparagine synthase (glutamine-hydrolysing)
MRFFTCVVRSDGGPVSEADRWPWEALPRSCGLPYEWQVRGRMAVLVCGDRTAKNSLVVSHAHHVAVGTARLDNRPDLLQWLNCGSQLTDLELVLHTIIQHGATRIQHLLGDFAFVVWNGNDNTGIAACDAFGVAKLFYAKRNGSMAFSSRAEALARGDVYELQHLAELVALCSPSPNLTVYSGVHPVPAGSFAQVERDQVRLSSFWSPEDYEPAERPWRSERDAAVACRDLLCEAIRLRLDSSGSSWAQLSGGLDSSSVVSLAQWQAERGAISQGLAGTVTHVDQQGTGTDEREYASAVVSRWGIRNETILDPPFWYDPGEPLPQTDQPRYDLPFYPRERRLCRIVRSAGGSVVLTGVGGDELFTGTMVFFADWLARGRIEAALREMTHWAVLGRVSFWDLAYRNALLPLLPRKLLSRMLRDQGQMPPWVSVATARRHHLKERTFAAATYTGRWGHKYHHAIVTSLMGIGQLMDYGIIRDSLEVRHPYLYRPLVEFALRLPPDLCTRPQARKWLLREAMRGILPEVVRQRIGKGTTAGLCGWTLTAQRALLEPLAKQSILAELGIIDQPTLSAAFDTVPHQPHRRDELHATLLTTLIIEAWLQMRSGRWPPREYRSLSLAANNN